MGFRVCHAGLGRRALVLVLGLVHGTCDILQAGQKAKKKKKKAVGAGQDRH